MKAGWGNGTGCMLQYIEEIKSSITPNRKKIELLEKWERRDRHCETEVDLDGKESVHRWSQVKLVSVRMRKHSWKYNKSVFCSCYGSHSLTFSCKLHTDKYKY